MAGPLPGDGLSVPVWCVSLPDCLERRRLFSSQMEGLRVPFRFLDGTDGRTGAVERFEASGDYDPARRLREKRGFARPLAATEVGCALSHVSVYREMAARETPGVLFDLCLGQLALFPEAYRPEYDPGDGGYALNGDNAVLFGGRKVADDPFY